MKYVIVCYGTNITFIFWSAVSSLVWTKVVKKKNNTNVKTFSYVDNLKTPSKDLYQIVSWRIRVHLLYFVI